MMSLGWQPGFKALNDLKPNLAAVAANPGALATLFQQGQVDISPGNFNAIQILKARGVPVEFVSPKEGAIAFKTSIHVVKNSPNRQLAVELHVDDGTDDLRDLSLPERSCSLSSSIGSGEAVRLFG